MSVPVNKRKSGTLEVCVLSRDLAHYTFIITANTHKFAPSQSVFIRHLQNTALTIHASCWEANEIRATTNEKHKRRTALQEEAISKCDRMMALIDIALPLFHLEAKRCTYWSGKVRALRDKIINWKESDIKRYKKTSIDNL